jgi:hypothetical protein
MSSPPFSNHPLSLLHCTRAPRIGVCPSSSLHDPDANVNKQNCCSCNVDVRRIDWGTGGNVSRFMVGAQQSKARVRAGFKVRTVKLTSCCSSTCAETSCAKTNPWKFPHAHALACIRRFASWWRPLSLKKPSANIEDSRLHQLTSRPAAWIESQLCLAIFKHAMVIKQAFSALAKCR